MKKTVLGCIVFLLGAVLAAQESATAAGAFQQSNAAQVASNDLADSTPNARVAMATADYPVTAGDVYSLAFAAGTEPVSYTIPVDSTYKIRVANLGVISCAGLTYLQLKQQVEALVTKNYIMSGVQFVLVMPGSFKVTVTGEVTRTQEKSAWALTRLSSIVAGTFTDYSSDRDITVESSSGKKHVYDLYKARRNGALDQDPYVRPGQTVTVNRVLRKVTISGAVERPGSYELMKGENLRTLVENYGSGLTDVADTSRITLIRTLDGKDTSGSTVYLDASALNADYELFNRDSIVIASISDLLPYITVEGIINNPALQNKDDQSAGEGRAVENATTTYKTVVRFHEGENYGPLTRRIAGQFNNYSDLEKAYIMRDGRQLAIDLAHLLYNADSKSQYDVVKDDKLIIPFTQNFTNRITINGEVLSVTEKPAWPLKRLSEVISDVLTPYSSSRMVTVTSTEGLLTTYDLFKAQRYGDMTQNPYIQSGETVTLNRFERRVTVSGAVERPGTYELRPGENLKELIAVYGGTLAKDADTSRIVLTRSIEGTAGGNTYYLDAASLDSGYELFNRDNVSIGSLDDLLPYVTVEGIINNPSLKNKDEELASEGKSAENVTASYKTIVRFHEGETYATLARRMAGQFNNYSDLEHAYIMRKNQQIAIDLAYLLYNAGAVSQYRLEKDDKLVIPFTQNFTNKIVVNGEVTAVTEKTAWPLKRLSEVIGDLTTPYSSTREVTVTGPEGNKTTYDLFLSTRFGDMSQNPYIQSGDTVTVNRIDRKVTISGAVERPGTYELLKGENLKDLIEKYGGGLAPLADSSRMELYRITDEKNSGKQYYLSAKDIADNTALVCYDSVKVCSYTDLQSAMFIEGAVSIGTVATNLETSSRITVTFHEGENYASLVRRMKTIFSASSDTTKAYIIRTVKAEGKGDEAAYEQKKIPINLDEILYDASFYSTEYVHKDDTLLVPFRQFFVTVAGAVNSPGRFPYIPDRTWDYYVALAGGIDSSRNSLDAVDIVDVVGKRHDKSEVIEPEVIITVKENSLLYKWNKVSGSITSILSIIATVLSIIVVTNGLRS